nr:MAG TPA: hypothetical protein [Caudoviricetes sp.]
MQNKGNWGGLIRSFSFLNLCLTFAVAYIIFMPWHK